VVDELKPAYFDTETVTDLHVWLYLQLVVRIYGNPVRSSTAAVVGNLAISITLAIGIYNCSTSINGLQPLLRPRHAKQRLRYNVIFY